MPERNEERGRGEAARTETGVQVFISHCTADQETIVEPLVRILQENMLPDCSLWRNSTRAGGLLSEELKNSLRQSDLILALITDSYLRSSYCLAELSAAWVLDKALIPVLLTPPRGNCATVFSI